MTRLLLIRIACCDFIFDCYYGIVSRQLHLLEFLNRHSDLSDIIGTVIASVGWSL